MVTLVSYPFEGQAVGESQYGALADLWLATGVVRHQLNEMAVSADSSGMQVQVASGRAVVRGVFVENPTLATLPISGANASLPRKDLVVVRVDYVQNRVDLDVLTGVPAASPVIPSLTRTGTIWETGLADVLVDAAAVTIAAGKVTDRRADQSYFGWAGSRYPATNVLSTAKPATWSEGGLIYLTDTDVLEVNTGTSTSPTWAVVYPQSFTAGGTPTTILPDDAAAAGVGTGAARLDHRHGIAADVPVTQAYNDVAAEGSSTSFARSDHRHGMPGSGAISYGSPGSSAVGDTVADGAAGTVARSDHRHGREAFGVPALTLGIANSAGVAPSPIRSDASIALFDATVPVTQAFGDAAAAGAAAVAARRDHKHGMPAASGSTSTVAVVAAAQSVVNSTTLVNCTSLSFAVGANENWVGYVALLCQSAAVVGDFKFGWTIPGGGGNNIEWVVHGPSTAETVGVTHVLNATPTGSSGSALTAGALGATATTLVLIYFTYDGGVSAGTVQLQFAQNTSDPTACFINSRSFLHATRQ